MPKHCRSSLLEELNEWEASREESFQKIKERFDENAEKRRRDFEHQKYLRRKIFEAREQERDQKFARKEQERKCEFESQIDDYGIEKAKIIELFEKRWRQYEANQLDDDEMEEILALDRDHFTEYKERFENDDSDDEIYDDSDDNDASNDASDASEASDGSDDWDSDLCKGKKCMIKCKPSSRDASHCAGWVNPNNGKRYLGGFAQCLCCNCAVRAQKRSPDEEGPWSGYPECEN